MALVQQSAETVNTGSSTTDTVTFSSATTAGNLVLLMCFGPADGSIVFSSSGFTLDGSRTGANVGAVAVLRKIETSGTTTYTVTHTGVLPYRVIGLEFDSVDSGVLPQVASGRDGTNSGGTTMYAAPSGEIDTTAAGPIVAIYCTDRNVTTTGPSGWTGGSGTRFTADASFHCYMNYTITTGAVTDERGAVTTSADLWQACAIVAYKTDGGGSSSALKRKLLLGVG